VLLLLGERGRQGMVHHSLRLHRRRLRPRFCWVYRVVGVAHWLRVGGQLVLVLAVVLVLVLMLVLGQLASLHRGSGLGRNGRKHCGLVALLGGPPGGSPLPCSPKFARFATVDQFCGFRVSLLVQGKVI